MDISLRLVADSKICIIIIKYFVFCLPHSFIFNLFYFVCSTLLFFFLFFYDSLLSNCFTIFGIGVYDFGFCLLCFSFSICVDILYILPLTYSIILLLFIMFLFSIFLSFINIFICSTFFCFFFFWFFIHTFVNQML